MAAPSGPFAVPGKVQEDSDVDLLAHFSDTGFLAKMVSMAAYSGSEKTGVYLRFGHWPEDERSFSPAGGYHEEGVSAYDLDRHGNPAIDHGLGRGHDQHYDDCDVDEFGTCQYSDPEPPDNDPMEEMQGRVHRAEKNRRYGGDKPGETAHLVRGDRSGVGYDGEPLLRNVRRVGDWIDHRHLFIPGARPHRLARDPSDEDYEPPEEAPPIRSEAASRPGRDEVKCPCCKGAGSHGGDSCHACDGEGSIGRGDTVERCPGEPQPRRRHWREAAAEGGSGKTWLHGTRSQFSPGDLIGFPGGHVWATLDPEVAHDDYAHGAKGDGRPRVYEVEPTGPSLYPADDDQYKSEHPMRVVREYPYECDRWECRGQREASASSREAALVPREELDEHLRRWFSPQQLEASTYPHPKTGYDIKTGLEYRIARPPEGQREGPAEFRVTDYGPPGASMMHQFNNPQPNQPVGHVYRGVSADEWKQARERGYLQSDQRGTLASWEGTNAGTEPETAVSYLPRGGSGHVLKIRVHPDDKWFTIPHDEYVRTRERIPLERVEAVSPLITKTDSGAVESIGSRHEAAMPEPDYESASDLPVGRGVWYRAHVVYNPLSEEGARSREMNAPGPGLRGYSAFAHPQHLHDYMHELEWPGNEDLWDDRRVIAFHGKQVGRGADNEPLVVPEANRKCCGNVIHSQMTWDEFEDRLPGAAPLHPRAVAPWRAYPPDQTARSKSVRRHYQDETDRLIRQHRQERHQERLRSRQEGRQAMGSREEYGYQHGPLESSAPIHALTGIPGAYDDPGRHTIYPESARQFLEAKGNPDHPVRVYRAAPAKSGGTINTGDWVATAHEYARDMAEERNYYDPEESLLSDPPTPESTHHVYEATVPARDVRSGLNDLSEWGYWGAPLQAEHSGNCPGCEAPGHVAALEVPATPREEPSGDYKDFLGHFEAAGDYRGQHTAPGPAAGHLPLSHYTGESPDARVRVYRSAPPGTEAINPGDWVSLSVDYAHQHGRHPADSAKDWPAYTAEVRQGDVHWDENDENEHGYNGPAIHHPDVHDEETGQLHDWDDWHEAHPHGLEAWAGAAVHLPQAEHDFVHDEFEWEPDRATTLLDAARAQGALRPSRWHDDLYPAREDAEDHAGRIAPPEGHRLTAFTLHRDDAGKLADVAVHSYRPDDEDLRRYQNMDMEERRFNHPAFGEVGSGTQREAALEVTAGPEDYGVSHRPSDDLDQFHDLGDHTFPEDVYDHPEYFSGSMSYGREHIRQMRAARGKPDHPVTIYRAMHRDAPREVNPGDWVTTSRRYAQFHAETQGYPEDDWHVVSAVVPARHVRSGAGSDLYEWGYWGPRVSAEAPGGQRPLQAEGALKDAAPDDGGIPVERSQMPSGGATYPHMHVLTATHPDGTTAELRYMTSKRDGRGIVDHAFIPKGYAGSLGRSLVQEARRLHPGTFVKGLPGIDEDWEQHLPSVTSLHRHLTMRLSPDDHAYVHDESVPRAQRARHLLGLMEQGGASMHWASQRGGAAAGKFGDHEFRAPGDTQVAVTADAPAREDVETDPERISRNGGYAYQPPDWEVPLREGARVTVRSVRWRAGDSGWTRHQFRDGHQFTAGVAPAAALEQMVEAAVHEPTPRSAVLANPHTGGTDWYHGSPYRFSGFHGDRPDSPLLYEGDPEDGSHWNTLLGHHFTASHGTAEEFSQGIHSPVPEGSYEDDRPQENVIHARLGIRNPKVYASEHDMDQEAYEHEWRAGNHHDKYHEPELLSDDDWDVEDRPATYQYAGHGDRMRGRDEADPVYWHVHRTFHPYATGWLNSHPDKAGIADRHRQRLIAQGHDGIVYGNEFEGDRTGKGDSHHIAAVPFSERQIDVTQRHCGPDCVAEEHATRQWPGRDQPPLFDEHGQPHEGSLAVVAHFGEPPRGKTQQLKLFHMQPDPRLHDPASGRHNPEQPFAHSIWRGEYQPDECEHCGGDLNFPEEHADTHHQWLTSQDWYTDWDEEGPGDTIHRGIGLDLPDHVHQVVHDESRPVAERAHALLSHVLSDDNAGGSGLGNFWSGHSGVSKVYAESAAQRYGRQNVQTPVIIHAHTPDREHFETDPDELQHWGVFSYHLAGNREVPITHGAPLRVRGISWAPPGHQKDAGTRDEPPRLEDDPAWAHHEIGGEGIRATASGTLSSDHAEEQRAALEAVAHFEGEAQNPPCRYCGEPLDDEDVHDGASAHSECSQMRWCEPHQDYHEDPVEAENHNDAYTDWSMHLPLQGGIHRGFPKELPADVHQAVHDPARQVAERAEALRDYLDENPYSGNWQRSLTDEERYGERGHLGVHWTDSEPHARGWAQDDMYEGPRGSGPKPSVTHVVLHARSPEREDIEQDPEELDRRHMYGFDHPRSEREVPLRVGAPVHLTGISWKRGDEDEWSRHDFPEASEHTAGLELIAADDDEPEDEFPDPDEYDDRDDDEDDEWNRERRESEAAQEAVRRAETEARRAALPYVPPPPDDQQLIDHVHHMHGLPAQTTDLYHTPQGRARWHAAEHRARAWNLLKPGEAPHQHDHLQGIPGERQWPAAFQLSEHTDFAGGTPEHGRFERVLSDPEASRPFAPLRPSESSLRLPPVVAHFDDKADAGGTWEHLQEQHGVRLAPGRAAPGEEFLSGLHSRMHAGEVPSGPGAVQHRHPVPAAGSGQSRGELISRMFSPIPEEELAAQRQVRVPQPERLDDREYSIRDVSRHYDWEGFDPFEIGHLVRNPEQATFTREDVPVHSLRHVDEHGSLVPPPSYHEIASQGEDERRRLEELEHGYDQGARIPPIVVVRDGEHHIIADGSHRAAVHAEHGQSHIPAFVTQRTIYPGRTAALEAAPGAVTAAYDWHEDEGPFTWDEIASRHPGLYDESDENGYDGPQIADAAAELYHDRPGHPYSETTGELNPAYGGGEMLFHPRTVDPRRIDYISADPGDERVRRARQGYESQRPERVPPLILVHRHGVYNIADGHHRAKAAFQAGKPVRAYVAYSPHDEPFAGKYDEPPRRAPFHGAELEDREPYPDQNGVRRRISYPGFPHAADVPHPGHLSAEGSRQEVIEAPAGEDPEEGVSVVAHFEPGEPTGRGGPEEEREPEWRAAWGVRPDAECPDCNTRADAGAGAEQLRFNLSGQDVPSYLARCQNCGKVYDSFKSGEQARIDREFGEQAYKAHRERHDLQEKTFSRITNSPTSQYSLWGDEHQWPMEVHRQERQNVGPGGIPYRMDTEFGRRMHENRLRRLLQPGGNAPLDPSKVEQWPGHVPAIPAESWGGESPRGTIRQMHSESARSPQAGLPECEAAWDDDDDPDRYVHCDQGHQHWGANGAAGMLIRHQGDDGQTRYLLQRRSPYVQHGSTWSTPGGALAGGESPEEGAWREAEEELGPLPDDITHHHTVTDDHGGWAYHTVVADSPRMFEPRGGHPDADWESSGHRWVTPAEMRELPLHPGFAASWDRVRKSGALERPFPRDHWDMTEAEARRHLEEGHGMAATAEEPHVTHWHEHSGDVQRHVHPDLEREFVREVNPGTPQGDEFTYEPGSGPIDPVFGALEPGPDQHSAREERGDRWHEFRNRGGDGLHRGILVELPEHLHAYVHDESVPREQRAMALQQHFADSGEGLGMHWTPHVDIASRAILNSADDDESSAGAYRNAHGWQGDDDYYDEDEDQEDGAGPRRTAVMFHVARPGERNRVRDPAELERHGIGWAHSKDEDEFPLKPGSPLRLTGISWKPHEPQYPFEPYEHADLPRPVRHVSSRQGAAAPRGQMVIAASVTDQVAIPARQEATAASPGPWEPETPEDAERLVREFPVLFRALHEGLAALADRMDEQPVDEEVPAIFRRMALACLTAAEDADRLLPPLDGDPPEGTWQGPRELEAPKE